jgi:putative N6-adenine-specific DNA methylase
VWTEERERARAAERRGTEVRIAASDHDGTAVAAGRRNARAAGVEDKVAFRQGALEDFAADGEYGCIVCNPPYGERLGGKREAREIARALGNLHRRLPSWSVFALSADEEFQRHFGARASRNRKLYNGNIRCWCYQYFGPRPPR